MTATRLGNTKTPTCVPHRPGDPLAQRWTAVMKTTQRFGRFDSDPLHRDVDLDDFDARPTRVGPPRVAEGTIDVEAAVTVRFPKGTPAPQPVAAAPAAPIIDAPSVQIAAPAATHPTHADVDATTPFTRTRKETPHNIVPFVKPRAMAEIAAANPRALQVTPHNPNGAPNGTMIGRHI